MAIYLGIYPVSIAFISDSAYRHSHRTIRLKQSHTGAYLAQETADCLKRFGLDKKFHTICMDNASNCDSTATHLERHIPSFRGALSRTRCFPHTINLVAKAFISFFFRQVKRKKPVKVAPGKRRHGAQAATVTSAVETDIPQADREILEDADGQGDSVDEGKEAHDEEAISGVRARAIEAFKNDYGISLSAKEEQTALGIFPKVRQFSSMLNPSC